MIETAETKLLYTITGKKHIKFPFLEETAYLQGN